MNSFENILTNDSRFSFENGLYYQKNLLRNNSFESNYLQLRYKEGRVYTDEVARQLPEFYGNNHLTKEWRARKRSAVRLIQYFQNKKINNVIEIGCGNGWLIQHLHQSILADYCGIDINETELRQAVRISNRTSTCFVYGNVLSGALSQLKADVIIIASAAQYFQHFQSFINQLLPLLTPNGEIHILDTPFYNQNEIENARKRSENYFTEAGVQPSEQSYYHHSWKSLKNFNYTIAYQPESLINKLKRIFITDSPFPWLIIKKAWDE